MLEGTIELKGQPKDRAGTTYYDDFGRPYSVEMDRRTMASVGLPTPRFRAPFYVPFQHLKERPDQLGRFFIDFDAWILEVRQAQDERGRQLQRLARDMAPNSVGDVLANPRQFPAIMVALGDEPLSDRFIRALRVGHPWATGEEEGDPATLLNRKGERLFSDSDIASLERFRNVHRTLATQLATDDDEFLPLDADGAPLAPPEELEEFGVTEAPARPRGRGRPRKTG